MNEPKPITIKGVDYPSVMAASIALGISRPTITRARDAGTLDDLGVKKLMRVSIRGVDYENAHEAAKALGVTPNAIYVALHRGTVDWVGIKREIRRPQSKPFSIGGMRWPSMTAASIDLGFHPCYVAQAKRKGSTKSMQRIIAAAMALKAKREAQERIAA